MKLKIFYFIRMIMFIVGLWALMVLIQSALQLGQDREGVTRREIDQIEARREQDKRSIEAQLNSLKEEASARADQRYNENKERDKWIASIEKKTDKIDLIANLVWSISLVMIAQLFAYLFNWKMRKSLSMIDRRSKKGT